jgi:hypothetical protein
LVATISRKGGVVISEIFCRWSARPQSRSGLIKKRNWDKKKAFALETAGAALHLPPGFPQPEPDQREAAE